MIESIKDNYGNVQFLALALIVYIQQEDLTSLKSLLY